MRPRLLPILAGVTASLLLMGCGLAETAFTAATVGASKASGGGRLARSYGAGAWRGIITGDRCSGTWQATRS